jgi:nitrate reductase alpha subunit
MKREAFQHSHTLTLSTKMTTSRRRPTTTTTTTTRRQQGQQVSVLQTFAEEFKLGGWERVAGFATKGFVARTAHVALTTALMKNATGFVYDFLYADE